MAITIDWANRIIQVPRADMTLIQTVPTEIRELDLDVFRLTLKALEASEDGMPWLDTHRHNTTVTVGGVTLARVVEIINNYTVTFEDGQYAVNLVNANSNVADVVNVNQVSVRAANSAGLVNLSELQLTAFIGKDGVGVSVDPINGTDSITYPVGTRPQPCKTEQNFEDISNNKRFRNIYVMNQLELALDHSATEHVFIGDNPLTVGVNILPSADVSGSEFQNLYVTGKMGSNTILRGCAVGSITNANSFIYESTIIGPIVLSGNISIEECWVSPAVIDREITIDFDNLPVQCIVSDWSAGIIRAKNMVTGSVLGVSGGGGIIRVDVANTGGTIIWGGGVTAETTNSGLLDVFNDSSISGQVWADIRALTVTKYLGLK